MTWLWLLACQWIVVALARPELVLTHDDRKYILAAEFGFLPGGRLELSVSDLEFSTMDDPGQIAFYIQLSPPTFATDYPENARPEEEQCLLDDYTVKTMVQDGYAFILPLDEQKASFDWSHDVTREEASYWYVYLVSCKQRSDVSMRLKITETNPGPRYLSAGDMPLSKIYACMAVLYLFASGAWIWLLRQPQTKVFRSHWLLLALFVLTAADKVFQSAKYHYMDVGKAADGWTTGFYIFALLKGCLGVVVVILIASGYMFIKPFLSVRDKLILLTILPLQVLANIARIVIQESAIGSGQYEAWSNWLPVIDMVGGIIMLRTIIQTRRFLRSTKNSPDKEYENMRRLSLWSTFYMVTVAYIYITLFIVQFLHAALPYHYVRWVGETVNECVTFAFYVFLGYQFQPYESNPYTRIPHTLDDGDEAFELSTDGDENMVGMMRREHRSVHVDD